MINHREAQELHEIIGAAIETGDLSELPRAREIASVIVSDTEPAHTSPLTPEQERERATGRMETWQP